MRVGKQVRYGLVIKQGKVGGSWLGEELMKSGRPAPRHRWLCSTLFRPAVTFLSLFGLTDRFVVSAAFERQSAHARRADEVDRDGFGAGDGGGSSDGGEDGESHFRCSFLFLALNEECFLVFFLV